MSSWKIIDRGAVPTSAALIEYTCPGCEREADLPVKGLAIAQTAAGVVFDSAPHALPSVIQCPHCRRRYEVA